MNNESKIDSREEHPEGREEHEELTEAAKDPSAAEEAPEPSVDVDANTVEARLARAMADMANFRKRQAKDLEDARRRAIEGIATELLPVIDNFYLALAAHEQQDQRQGGDGDAMVEGLKMVRSLLLGVLERHGLSEIRAEGAKFDPRRHEAVGVDTDPDTEPGRITRVMQRGYALGDKVVRASRVIVSGEPDETQGNGTDEED